VHERPAGGHGELVAVALGFGVVVAAQHDCGAELGDGLDLDRRRRLRHHDQRVQAEMPGREGDPLRVVAGAGGDDAAGALGVVHVRDPVVGAAQLVAEDRLQVFALQQHLVAETTRQPMGLIERRFLRDVVDAAVQDQPQHRVGIDHRGLFGTWHLHHSVGRA
jgi:hypothetical protein